MKLQDKMQENLESDDTKHKLHETIIRKHGWQCLKLSELQLKLIDNTHVSDKNTR